MRVSLDTSVIISHLKADEFFPETLKFFRWAREKKLSLIISGVVYAELYAGIFLSKNPEEEEYNVQKFLATNNISVHLGGSLEVAKRAGQIFSLYLLQRLGARKRILPDFLIASHAEAYSEALVTWNPADFKGYLNIQALTPTEAVDKLSD
ncbi:MAG: type II toxin-antitoxin system VapC family toxin [Candidatus Freyarchaeota archaeon]